MKNLKYILLTLFAAHVFNAKAGEETVSQLIKGEAIRTASLQVMDQLYGHSTGFTTHKQHVYVKLYHNDINKVFRNYDWELQVIYTVDLRLSDGSLQTKIDTLIIDGDDGTDETGLSKNIDYIFYNSAAYGDFTATSVTFKKGDGTNITEITTDFHLEAGVVTERYYDFTTTQNPTVESATFQSSDKTLEVNWSYQQGAEYYDLEWIYVADGDTSATGNHQNDAIPYDFSNATRVSLGGNTYNIPLAYSKGSIIYRVRGVAYDLTRNDFKNYPKYGKWSYEPTTFTVAQANSDHSTSKCYYYYTGHDANKNWTYTVAFAEDGKRKETATYFDGSGRQRQSVVVQNTDGYAIIGESKYDYAGRKAVDILPVPVASEGVKFYGTSVAPFNGNWDRDNFATDAHLNENNTVLPEALPSNSEAYKYYSSSNSLSFINKEAVPDAEGYPYSFTQVSNDGTGRPVVQSMPGKKLRYKAQNDHISKYFYGTPTQSEIDRLFGNEAGDYVFYKKNITVDPNGQQSVQYLDYADRVIATALAGDNPSNLDTIINKETKTIVTPLFSNKTIGTNGYVQESMEYMSTSFDAVDIDYGLTQVDLTTCQSPTSGSGSDILYDVHVEVKNSRGQLVVESTLDDISSRFNTQLLTFNPGIGNYTITRTIKIDSADKAKFLARHDSLADANKFTSTCKPYYDLDTDTICPVLDCDSSCYNSFTYELEGIIYYLDTAGNVYEPDSSNSNVYVIQGDPGAGSWSVTDTTSPFNVSIKYCITECEAFLDTNNAEGQAMLRYFRDDRCDISLNVLLSDMSPGGQYLDNTPNDYIFDENGFATPLGSNSLYLRIGEFRTENGDRINIIRAGDTVNPATSSDTCFLSCEYITYNSATGFYEGYSCDTVCKPLPNRNSVLSSGNLSSFNALLGTSYPSWDSVRNDWQQGYDSLLIQFHPEYCAFQFFCNYSFSCGANTVSMDDLNTFLGEMYLAQSYADANSNSGSYDFMNPLLLTPTAKNGSTIIDDESQYIQEGATGSYNKDPLFTCSGGASTELSTYAHDSIKYWLQHFIPVYTNLGTFTGHYYSLWYLLDDPDEISDGKSGNNSGLHSKIVEVFNIFHGDGQCLDGLIQNNDDKFYYFRSIYLFLREKAIYDWFDDYHLCSNGQLYSHWDADTNYDGVIDAGTYKNFTLHYPRNPIYELFDVNNPNNSVITDALEANTQGLKDYQPITSLDTCACASFESYLSDNGLSSASSTAIATKLYDDFCVNYTVGQVDTFKLCMLDSLIGYKSMVYLPDSLKCDPQQQYLQNLADECSRQLGEIARFEAEKRYQEDKAAYLDSLSAAYDVYAYNQLKANETISLDYTLGEYHYTLYYYDQAGNLVKTIPPNGVNPLTSTQITNTQTYRDNGTGGFVRPAHTYVTNYRYNAQNQQIFQFTPDGDSIYFWYDDVARMVASQNVKQSANNQFSYTIYDGLGRIVENGQITQTKSLTDSILSNQDSLKTWLSGGGRAQVVFTLYDEPLYDVNGTGTNQDKIEDAFIPDGQEYLRNRVAASFYIDTIAPSVPYIYHNDRLASIPSDYLTYIHANHYSYDPHGNVTKFVQEIPELNSFDRRFFTLEYNYDLISGNVNQVSYQAGKSDQFHHRYFYDADNRIQRVETSLDGRIWEKDAQYYFYPHGPLSRTEIGDMNVQGMDYAYTLQGWLKSINGTSLGKNQALGTYDLGTDAKEVSTNKNQVFTSDVYGFALDYFTDDYKTINTSNFLASFSGGSNAVINNTRSLYNGNIGRMTTASRDINQNVIDGQSNVYHYDQLNRLTYYKGYKETTLDETNASSSALSSGYQTAYSYDPNGNITSLERWKNGGTKFDNLTYTYDINNSAVSKRNRLLQVDDVIGNAVETTDIDDQTAIPHASNYNTNNNYEYDAIGNLIRDDAEEIEHISWSVRNKVADITRSSGSTESDLSFEYGPNGNRFKKVNMPTATATSWISTFYVRDPNGKIMGTYKKNHESGSYKLALEEQSVYGTDRLGLTKRNGEVKSVSTSHSDNTTLNAGYTHHVVLNETNFVNLSSGGGFTATISPVQGPVDIRLSGETTVSVIGGIYELSGNTYTVNQGNSFTFNASGLLDIKAIGPFEVSSDYQLDFASGSTTQIVSSGNDRTVGKKYYEMKNHLGNVLNTVSDRKIWETIPVISSVFNYGFDNSEELHDWTNVNEAGLDVSDGELRMTFEQADQGMEQQISLNTSCSYELCITVSELEGPFKVVLLGLEDELLEEEEIQEPGTYCWTISGDISSILTIQILSLEAGFVNIDEIKLTQTCSDAYQMANVLSMQDYYPFGMIMPGRSYSTSDYRFGFNGYEKDDEVQGSGNSYTTDFRQFDPRLGRWLSPDPVIKNHESPYAWNTNNPILYIDEFGADSTQRANAVNLAEKFVAKNTSQDGSLYGGKGTEPGTSTDCSGMVSACVMAGGESNPNRAVDGGQRRKNGNQSGVLNIEDNTTEVSLNDVQVGNLYTMHKESNDSYHIGIISEVERDENGNVTSLTILHSEYNIGPTTDVIDPNNTNSRWVKRPHKILKWDTKPDLERTTNTEVEVQASTCTPTSAPVRAQNKERRSSRRSSYSWSDFKSDWNQFWSDFEREASNPYNWGLR